MPKGRPQKPKLSPLKTTKTPSLLRGFKDILPSEELYWQFLEGRIAKVAADYGFQRITTPLVEEASLFLHAIGKETDIVAKELFSFPLRDSCMVALRPEGTASVARAYINHGFWNVPQPVKLWYMGPMFRYDRPQAGRYRQFHQVGFEVIGSDHAVVDAELIALSVSFLKSLDVPVTLGVNSIGCRVCRPPYLQTLLAFARAHRKEICDDCKGRLKKNVLRILDCKEVKCQAVYANAPTIIDRLCEDCKKHFTRVLEYLDEMEISFTLSPRLVRGLDYYSRTVFEIVPATAVGGTILKQPKADEGFQEDQNKVQHKQKPIETPLEELVQKEDVQDSSRQDALGGGGRYDALIEMLGGRPTPALGVAFGMERLITALRPHIDALLPPLMHGGGVVFVAQLGEKARKKILKLKVQLMSKGIRVADALSKEGLRAQLEIAGRLKVAYTLILGEKEVIDNTIILRDMNEGVQEIVPFEKIVDVISAKLARKGSL